MKVLRSKTNNNNNNNTGNSNYTNDDNNNSNDNSNNDDTLEVWGLHSFKRNTVEQKQPKNSEA